MEESFDTIFNMGYGGGATGSPPCLIRRENHPCFSGMWLNDVIERSSSPRIRYSTVSNGIDNVISVCVEEIVYCKVPYTTLAVLITVYKVYVGILNGPRAVSNGNDNGI